MNKRNVATVLWFLTGWSLALMLAAFAGLPSIFAPLLATGLAAFVRWDPTGRIWGQRPVTSHEFTPRGTNVRLAE
jgi:hypothetical protein